MTQLRCAMGNSPSPPPAAPTLASTVSVARNSPPNLDDPDHPPAKIVHINDLDGIVLRVTVAPARAVSLLKAFECHLYDAASVQEIRQLTLGQLTVETVLPALRLMLARSNVSTFSPELIVLADRARKHPFASYVGGAFNFAAPRLYLSCVRAGQERESYLALLPAEIFQMVRFLASHRLAFILQTDSLPLRRCASNSPHAVRHHAVLGTDR